MRVTYTYKTRTKKPLKMVLVVRLKNASNAFIKERGKRLSKIFCVIKRMFSLIYST